MDKTFWAAKSYDAKKVGLTKRKINRVRPQTEV